MPDTTSDIYAQDLPAENLTTLDGAEHVIGFDTTEGKKIPVNALADFAVTKRQATLGGSTQTVQTAINSLTTRMGVVEGRLEEAEKAITWQEIAHAVASGTRPYEIGDLITDPWTDTAANSSYEYPWRVNHYESVEVEGGQAINGMWLQAKYAHPLGVQFSHQRAFLACPDGLAAGTYYITLGATWGSKDAVKDSTWKFTLTKAVEAGGRLAGFYGMPDQLASTWKVYSYKADGITLLETVNVTSGTGGTSLGTMALSTRSGNLNSMNETAYGWNRWKTSAIRQYLNSAAGIGEWWTPQDKWDIAPDQLTQKPGFLSGLPEGFVNTILPVKYTTYTNTVQDGGNADVTYDKVGLISLEQMYVTPQIAGEGESHDYWKQLNGTATKWATGTNNVYDAIKHYAVENHSSAQYVRLRSCYRGDASTTWYVNSGGYVYNYHASNAYRFAPLVFIG